MNMINAACLGGCQRYLTVISWIDLSIIFDKCCHSPGWLSDGQVVTSTHFASPDWVRPLCLAREHLSPYAHQTACGSSSSVVGHLVPGWAEDNVSIKLCDFGSCHGPADRLLSVTWQMRGGDAEHRQYFHQSEAS